MRTDKRVRATLQQQQPATLPALTESHSAFTAQRLPQFCTLSHSMAKVQRPLLSPSIAPTPAPALFCGPDQPAHIRMVTRREQSNHGCPRDDANIEFQARTGDATQH